MKRFFILASLAVLLFLSCDINNTVGGTTIPEPITVEPEPEPITIPEPATVRYEVTGYSKYNSNILYRTDDYYTEEPGPAPDPIDIDDVPLPWSIEFDVYDIDSFKPFLCACDSDIFGVVGTIKVTVYYNGEVVGTASNGRHYNAIVYGNGTKGNISTSKWWYE